MGMKIFVFEHLCSGCAVGDDISPHLIPMGGAMLQAVITDFQAMGAVVTTMLDHRVNLPLNEAQITRVSSSAQGSKVFEELSAAADFSLIIAPESDGILEGWIANLESRGCETFNSSLTATRLCADKLTMSKTLEVAGVKTPVTRLLQGSAMTDMARFPMVVKPRRGAGSEWTFVCRDPGDVQSIPQWVDWIVQPYVEGIAASCSVIVHGDRVTPLIAGMQIVEGNKQLHYRGGRLPLDSPTACELAVRAVQAVPGAKGYVGVDMVLGEDPSGSDDMVIEVNPRISMSYLGLRELCEQRITQAICGHTDPATFTWRKGPVRFNGQGQVTWEAVQ